MDIEKSKKLITSKIEAGTKTKIVRDAIKTDKYQNKAKQDDYDTNAEVLRDRSVK